MSETRPVDKILRHTPATRDQDHLAPHSAVALVAGVDRIADMHVPDYTECGGRYGVYPGGGVRRKSRPPDVFYGRQPV